MEVVLTGHGFGMAVSGRSTIVSVSLACNTRMAHLGSVRTSLSSVSFFTNPLAFTARGSIITHMISIELNKKLDYETYKNYWDLSVSGANFSALIKKDHPLITIENSQRYIDGLLQREHNGFGTES